MLLIFKETFNLSKIDKEEEIKSRLEKLNKQLDNLIGFIADGILVDKTKEKIEKLVEERKQVEESLENIKKDQRVNRIFESIKTLGEVWNYMSFEEQRNIVEHLIDKIIIDNNTLIIKWKISAN